MSNWSFKKHKDEGPQWPVDEENKPIASAVAAHVPDGQMIADSIVAMLHACDIPARVEYPGDGTLGRVVLGVSGYGVAILVPEDRLEEARALIETDASAAAEEESGTDRD